MMKMDGKIRMDGKIKMDKKWRIEMGYEMIPKDGSNGEDSVYVGDNIMAVMDGVGEWIKKGIDSKVYS